jgi:hypothetical protein
MTFTIENLIAAGLAAWLAVSITLIGLEIW